jgi:hypothetical protein
MSARRKRTHAGQSVNLELAGYQPRSKNLIYTFVRKSDAPCAVAP